MEEMVQRDSGYFMKFVVCTFYIAMLTSLMHEVCYWSESSWCIIEASVYSQWLREYQIKVQSFSYFQFTKHRKLVPELQIERKMKFNSSTFQYFWRWKENISFCRNLYNCLRGSFFYKKYVYIKLICEYMPIVCALKN